MLGKELGDRVPAITTLNEPWCSAFLGYASGEHAPGLTDDRLAYSPRRTTSTSPTAARSPRCAAVLPAAAQTLGDPEPAAGGAGVGHARPTWPPPGTSTPIANRIFLDPMLRGSYPDDLLAGTAHLTDWSFVHDGDLEARSGHRSTSSA